MIPIKYELKDNIATFTYNQDEFDVWNKRGKEHGDCGAILVSIDYTMELSTYLAYGTIEAPTKTRHTISIVHLELFDGKLLLPDDVIKPRQSKPIERGLTFIDFSKGEIYSITNHSTTKL